MKIVSYTIQDPCLNLKYKLFGIDYRVAKLSNCYLTLHELSIQIWNLYDNSNITKLTMRAFWYGLLD